MSARAGVYSKIKKTFRLADPRSRPGARVFVLECNHSRTGNHSVKSTRMWCGVCTKQDKLKASRITVTRGELARLVKREAQKLHRMTAQLKKNLEPANAS